jgi:predicted protein tyrosine phosphatase
LSNFLFICSKNQWRSPTAELLFKNHLLHQARSAGTSEKARVRVNERLIAWADIIFSMEQRHKDILKKQYAHLLKDKVVIVLDIEDHYRFNDPELVNMLITALEEYL